MSPPRWCEAFIHSAWLAQSATMRSLGSAGPVMVMDCAGRRWRNCRPVDRARVRHHARPSPRWREAARSHCWFPHRVTTACAPPAGSLSELIFMQSGHLLCTWAADPRKNLRFWINLVGYCTLASAGRARAKKAQNDSVSRLYDHSLILRDRYRCETQVCECAVEQH